MALAIKQADAKVDQPGENIIIDDNTGNYDASTNLTGWGAPNLVRADTALLLLITYKGTKDDTIIAPLTFDPHAVTSFTVPASQGDGRYQSYMFAVPNKTGSEQEGDYAYDTTEKEVQQLTSGVWNSKTLTELIGIASVIQNLQEIPFTSNGSKSLNKVSQSLLELELKGKTDCTEFRHLERDETILLRHLRSARTKFCSSNFMEFQRIIESNNELIANIDLVEDE